MRLRLPANERLQFLAGQYIDILLKDGKKRSFSLANAPHDDALLQLHIRHVPGGFVHRSGIFNHEGARHPALQRPAWQFLPARRLQKADDLPRWRHRLCADQGAGRARHCTRKCTRPMSHLLGRQGTVDLYQNTLPEQWAAAHAQIKYIPVLSEPTLDDAWTGRSGFVHQAAMADFPDLSGYQVYACGSPGMIETVKADFVKHCKLPEEEFFADAFSYSTS
jgi:CDP-4-dehydro-6-deoxyglucose reductase